MSERSNQTFMISFLWVAIVMLFLAILFFVVHGVMDTSESVPGIESNQGWQFRVAAALLFPMGCLIFSLVFNSRALNIRKHLPEAPESLHIDFNNRNFIRELNDRIERCLKLSFLDWIILLAGFPFIILMLYVFVYELTHSTNFSDLTGILAFLMIISLFYYSVLDRYIRYIRYYKNAKNLFYDARYEDIIKLHGKILFSPSELRKYSLNL